MSFSGGFMKVYHVMVEREDDWYVTRALEDGAVFTQGRSFDEIITNVREVVELLYGETNVQVEMTVPPEVPLGKHSTKRISHQSPVRKLSRGIPARR
jgi:predicted RNase H-like HicB family nuclease